MKKLLFLLFLAITVTSSAAVFAPLYEVTQLNGKYGLAYNGESCVYPIYDEIVLVEPMRQAWDQGKPLKVIKQQMHEITVAENQNRFTFGSYALNGKKGLMTMSQRITAPIYTYVKPYRKLRTFKKSGDQIVAFAIVGDENGMGVIDLSGNTIIPLEYKEIIEPIFIDEYECQQSNNNNIFFSVIDKEGVSQIIDINNNIIFSSPNIPADIQKELAKAEKKNNKNKQYALDTDAKVQSIVDAYRKVISIPLGKTAYEVSVCSPVGSSIFKDELGYGVKNESGEIIVPAIFDNITNFNSDGIARVIINDIEGYVNEHGFISFPYQILSFPGLIAPFDKTMEAYNTAFDVYPTNTYAWLAAADYLMNSSWATIGGRARDYNAASQCYDMAVSMANDRDELYYFTDSNLSDVRKAKSYANGTASPIEGQIERDGWALAADIFNSIVNFTSTLQNNNSYSSNFDAYLEDSNPSSNGSSSKKSSSTQSSRHGSVSETTAMHSDDRTYCNYETQLIKMKGGDNYSDSRRRDIQSKMRKIRKKWEDRGYNFYHSTMEDWGGN